MSETPKKERTPSEALGELLEAAGLKITIDPGRNNQGNCTFCGALPPPRASHDLPVLGTYFNDTPLSRPVCRECRSLAEASGAKYWKGTLDDSTKPATTPPPVKLWRYYLRGTKQDPWEWAEVVLGSEGFFATVSDYGNYSFSWTHFGRTRGVDFRDFFSGLGPDYVHSKISAGSGRVYDPKASAKKAREMICKARRNHYIHARAARDAWNEIDDDYGHLDDAFAWNDWALHSVGADLLSDFYEIYEFCYSEMPEPQSWMFCTKILPRLQQVLKDERSAGAAVPGPTAPAASPMTGTIL